MTQRPIVANASGVVLGPDGKRLYGMDAELHLKRQAQRDPEFELSVAKWISEAIKEPLLDENDLWVSLKSGVVLCKLVNAILPGTIAKYNTTRLMPLMEMDNIQLYLKACWNLGVPSGDFFIVSDLYQKKSMLQVIQNIVSVSRLAPSLGYGGAPLAATNSNENRVKNWETVISGGDATYVEDLEKGTPAERITELTIQLGETQHEVGTLTSTNANLRAEIAELKQKHRTDRQKWVGEKSNLENRLQKFEPIDTGEEGEAGSMAVQAMELHFQREIEKLKNDIKKEQDKYEALNTKYEALRKKHSITSHKLSQLQFDMKKGGSKPGGSPEKPEWMNRIQKKKPVSPRRRGESRVTRDRNATELHTSAQAGYRLSTMMQVRNTVTNRKSGFFFNADVLQQEGVAFLQEQVQLLFKDQTIDDDSSTAMNELLHEDTGRRTFIFVLKETLRNAGYKKLKLSSAPFFSLLGMINSALTGMIVNNETDFIALTFLLGAARSISTQTRGGLEQHISDFMRDHTVWDNIRFWEQHFWDVIAKAFKKKFNRRSLTKAQLSGWGDPESKFVSQFAASFQFEMSKWSLAEKEREGFLDLVFERLQLPEKYRKATQTYYQRLLKRQQEKSRVDEKKLRRMTLAMSKAQLSRISKADDEVLASNDELRNESNFLQGWIRRKVSTIWVTEWVNQTGTILHIKEFAQSTSRRMVLDMEKITVVESITDATLPEGSRRCLKVTAAGVTVILAPVKDTTAEFHYWLRGFQTMQKRYSDANAKVVPKLGRSSLRPKGAEQQEQRKDPETPKKQVPKPPSRRERGAVVSNAPKAAPEPLKGQMQMLLSKELAKRAKGVKKGWHLMHFQQDGSNLGFAQSNPGTVLDYIDLSRISKIELASDPSIQGDVVRLHSAGVVFSFCPTNVNYWIRGFKAAKRAIADGSLKVTSATVAAPSISTPSIAVAVPDNMEGWLQRKEKQRFKSTWTAHWFSQTGSTLYYYKTQEALKLLGEIDLADIQSIEETRDNQIFGIVIRITDSAGTVTLLAPPKEQDSPMWLAAFKAMKKKYAGASDAASGTAPASPLLAATNVFKGLSRNSGRRDTLGKSSSMKGLLGRVRGSRDSKVMNEDASKASADSSESNPVVPNANKLRGTILMLKNKKWKPIVFELRGSRIILKKDDHTDIEGEIEVFLKDVQQITESSDPKQGQVLNIATPQGDYVFSPEDGDTFSLWMNTLQVAVMTIKAQGMKQTQEQSNDLDTMTPARIMKEIEKGRQEVSENLKNLIAAHELNSKVVGDSEQEMVTKEYQKLVAEHKGIRSRVTILKLEYEEATGKKLPDGDEATEPPVLSFGTSGDGEKDAAQQQLEKEECEDDGQSGPSFKPMQFVWAQYNEDELWYRAKIDNVILAQEEGSPDIFIVTFTEYGNQQECFPAQMRKIDDPSMLALLGMTADQVNAPPDSSRKQRTVSVRFTGSKVTSDLNAQLDAMAEAERKSAAAPREEEEFVTVAVDEDGGASLGNVEVVDTAAESQAQAQQEEEEERADEILGNVEEDGDDEQQQRDIVTVYLCDGCGEEAPDGATECALCGETVVAVEVDMTDEMTGEEATPAAVAVEEPEPVKEEPKALAVAEVPKPQPQPPLQRKKSKPLPIPEDSEPSEEEQVQVQVQVAKPEPLETEVRPESPRNAQVEDVGESSSEEEVLKLRPRTSTNSRTKDSVSSALARARAAAARANSITKDSPAEVKQPPTSQKKPLPKPQPETPTRRHAPASASGTAVKPSSSAMSPTRRTGSRSTIPASLRGRSSRGTRSSIPSNMKAPPSAGRAKPPPAKPKPKPKPEPARAKPPAARSNGPVGSVCAHCNKDVLPYERRELNGEPYHLLCYVAVNREAIMARSAK